MFEICEGNKHYCDIIKSPSQKGVLQYVFNAQATLLVDV